MRKNKSMNNLKEFLEIFGWIPGGILKVTYRETFAEILRKTFEVILREIIKESLDEFKRSPS